MTEKGSAIGYFVFCWRVGPILSGYLLLPDFCQMSLFSTDTHFDGTISYTATLGDKTKITLFIL